METDAHILDSFENSHGIQLKEFCHDILVHCKVLKDVFKSRKTQNLWSNLFTQDCVIALRLNIVFFCTDGKWWKWFAFWNFSLIIAPPPSGSYGQKCTTKDSQKNQKNRLISFHYISKDVSAWVKVIKKHFHVVFVGKQQSSHDRAP